MTQVFCSHCGLPAKRSRKQNDELVYCCYGCYFAAEVIGGQGQQNNVRWAMLRLGVASFFAMNVMGFSLALHASSVYKDYFLNISSTGKIFDELLRYFLLFMSAPVMLLLGAPLLEGVIQQLKRGQWQSDTLIAAGVFAAFIFSIISTLSGQGYLFFDVAVMVLTFLSLGRYLEANYRYQASSRLENLLKNDSDSYSVLRNGSQIYLDSEHICKDDLFVLVAGQKMPVDAEVIEGSALIEKSAVTGESIPESSSVGDMILSGCLIIEGYIRVRALADSIHSWVGHLKHLIEIARTTKPPIAKKVDGLSFLFSILCGVLFIVAVGLGGIQATLWDGFLRGLAVLLVACPCALGMAVPLALWKSFSQIVDEKISFKDLAKIETLAGVRTVFFDKTGTLTQKKYQVKSVHLLDTIAEDKLWEYSASLCQVSRHPLSLTIANESKKRNLKLFIPKFVETKSGQGISGELPGVGRVYIGSQDFLKNSGVQIPAADLNGGNFMAVWVAFGSKLQGKFEFEESLRPSAWDVVQRLKAMGIAVFVLTGDKSEQCKSLSEVLGVPVYSGLSPEEKLNIVRDWEKSRGCSLMVGEGLNDAPVISGAAVSVSMNCGLQWTRNEADFVLRDDDLTKVPWLIQLARQTMRRIHKNLFWAFFYNLLMLPAAVFGFISPIAAGAAMLLSSVFVVYSSLGRKTEII